MSYVGWASLGILVAAFVFQAATFRSRKNYRTPEFIFWGSALGIFVYYLYLVFSQYQAWKNDGGLGRFLIPPHESISYVFGYHFTRFFLYYLIAFIFGLALIIFTRHFNKKFEGKFFEVEEPYWAALSVFLLGNPAWSYAWIYYFILVLVVAVAGSAIKGHVLKKENKRFSFYWLWLPVAILVIIINVV